MCVCVCNGVQIPQLLQIGKLLKKNNVAVDVVSMGELEENTEKLTEFVKAVNSNDNRCVCVCVSVCCICTLCNEPNEVAGTLVRTTKQECRISVDTAASGYC
jgi:hypothetical protein